MIDCGKIYLNGKIFVMVFDCKNKKRFFYEIKDNERVEPSIEDNSKLIEIYDNRSWVIQDSSNNNVIKKKNKIRKEIIIAGAIVGIVITLFSGCTTLKNQFILDKNSAFIVEEPVFVEQIDAYVYESTGETIVIQDKRIIEVHKEDLSERMMVAINSNPNLTDMEKQYLSGYRQFFQDYGHLLNNAEDTAKAMQSVTIEYTGLDCGNILGDYDARNNHIRIYAGARSFADLFVAGSKHSLFHEFGHVIQFSNYDTTKESTEITRCTSEGINTIMTDEYMANDDLVSIDYIRNRAINQVLLEIVDNPEIVINMWLDDDDSEVCVELAKISGTEDDAKAFLEKTGIVENCNRAFVSMCEKYKNLDIEYLLELSHIESTFTVKFKEYYGEAFPFSNEQIMEILSDMQFIGYVKKTYEENLQEVSATLKHYYETKKNITIEEDLLASSYFDIIDNFTVFGLDSDTLARVNKPLINKSNIDIPPTLIFYRAEGTDDLKTHFYEIDFTEYRNSYRSIKN